MKNTYYCKAAFLFSGIKVFPSRHSIHLKLILREEEGGTVHLAKHYILNIQILYTV